MQRREFLGFSIAAGLSAAGLPGCSSSGPLRFGIHPWIGYEPLYLADDFNWLPETVALRPGTSATDSMEGLLAGALDGAALTLDETIRIWSRGLELVVVAVADVSAGADVLMVKPAIDELAALRGQRIAVELNGVSGIMLLKILEVAGLGPNDVTKVDLPVSQHADAWSRGEVDASVCYEPTASMIESLGGVRLFDSSDIPETIFDVLVVTRETAKKNSSSVRDLVRAHFAGLQHLVRNMHDSVYRVADRQGIAPDEVRSALATVMLPDLAANQRYLRAAGPIETIAGSLSRLMLAEGMIDRNPSIQRLSDPLFLPARVP
ncbi:MULTISPECIES: ABC transporter substrate-binding protein [unclassified Marinobacter]|uniref:ABC transporter substrate-binding protein n=1 Tax=unclassified Marinobacter TaxID=83889 RepID=UPI0019255C48|nr:MULTISPECIES: ABC transporter substrate-binding protein [unclassified Marinobacter]MBL3823323.1 ABC transporter substrate-binding protein [Marinobacter sp. MC3]MBL3892346.1 ABC transporter substrate-binding protein [Marinobacter sp. MW3]